MAWILWRNNNTALGAINNNITIIINNNNIIAVCAERFLSRTHARTHTHTKNNK